MNIIFVFGWYRYLQKKKTKNCINFSVKKRKTFSLLCPVQEYYGHHYWAAIKNKIKLSKDTPATHIFVCRLKSYAKFGMHMSRDDLAQTQIYCENIVFWWQSSRSYRCHEFMWQIVSWWYIYVSVMVWLYQRTKNVVRTRSHVKTL